MTANMANQVVWLDIPVLDLDRAIAKIRMLIAPRARVYVAVPDVTRFVTVRDAPFQEFSVEHVNFFSPTSLTNLMGRRGFRLVRRLRDVLPRRSSNPRHHRRKSDVFSRVRHRERVLV